MNKASKKTMLIGIVLVIVLALSASVAFAATGSYSGYTYKFKDLYSTKSLTKTGTGHGCFNVTKYGDGEDSDTAMGYCDFWLEFENGARITDKAQAGKKLGRLLCDMTELHHIIKELACSSVSVHLYRL
ncbi:Uncharacterised protein [uncultured Eubacterium sp.]|nr:Uncharacterised protein [uncultured Eubacterium sp.]